MKRVRGTEFPVKSKPMLSFVLSAVAALCGAPSPANAGSTLPGGGHFVAGTGSIAGNGTSLSINQNSSRAVIDWDSFSIGFGNRVNFNNGTGATLNRVTGNDLSMILGSLSATGSVYVINPHGIVVGPSGIVSTGGRFVASTLDADDTAFMNGGPLTLSAVPGSSDKSVINFGKIGSTGGDVFLVSAKTATNLGTISAPNGTAELAAGSEVLLQDSSSGRQVFVQMGSKGTVFNEGAIQAAQVSLQGADGNVYALSGNHQAIRATGSATRDGHVWLVADTGTVKLAGRIEAKNPDGSGGTVDTLAGNLLFCGCGPTVSARLWNITTPSFTIGNAAALSFSRSLNAGTSIYLQTMGGAGGNGNIDVASSMAWNGAASLTLGAYHGIDVDKGVTLKNQGSGNLTLRADATAIDNGGSVANDGTVDWSKSAGIVSAYYDMNGSYSPGTLLSNTSWAAPADSGLVTQITGYKLVDSLADLENVAADLAGNYALGRDIDASATSNGSYVPLGGGNTPFAGQFDGRGHTISSLTMQGSGTGAPAVGMFATLGKSAVVRDLNVNGSATIQAAPDLTSTGGTEGILAGENDGTVLRVNTSGTVSAAETAGGNSTTAGGLVGVNRGTIVRSSSSAATIAGANVGGLVGENDGVVTQSYASGTVYGGVYGVLGGISIGSPGGLVGNNNGTISQSYATGAVMTGCNEFVCLGGGALVYTNNGTISQSFATGAVLGFNASQGAGYLGPYGIAEYNGGSIAKDVYWNTETTGTAMGVGGGTPIPASNGLTTAQMSTPASFVGYDFGPNGVWAMPAGANHPVLAWQINAH
ncbi:two-partner secretion domain-containing protein [Trinickia dabaoshanensis]|nr:filamentous hemagglutinin N-terminal domain-containing protein [Trinickia dabaoshanensis]